MTGLCNLMWSATLRPIYCESRQYSPITMPLVMGRLPSLQSFSIGPLAVQAPQFRPSIFPFNYLLCVCSFMIDPWYAIKDVIHWILPIRVLHAVVFADVFCCSLFVFNQEGVVSSYDCFDSHTLCHFLRLVFDNQLLLFFLYCPYVFSGKSKCGETHCTNLEVVGAFRVVLNLRTHYS